MDRHHRKNEANEIELLSLEDAEESFKSSDDEGFISILINLILYDYEPLTLSALKLLFRHVR